MSVAIGINGFGRIGRNVLRLMYEDPKKHPGKIAAINDLTDAKTLAHLLKYDSVHGPFPGEISYSDGFISVNGDKIRILCEKDPNKVSWKELGSDIVLECTGVFTDKEKAVVHLKNGAKKVVVSAPSKDADATIVYGVNHTTYKPADHHVISCASCTTNCLAPVAHVLSHAFGIARGTMTTIHSYTNDQQILDLPHKDLRRARAAAMSMIPTSTGAAKAIGLVIPELAGKLDGFAIRVPTPDVSIVDLVVELNRDTTKEEINSTLKAAADGALKGILAYTEEPLVSSDYIGVTASSTVDALSTMVMQKRLAKVIAWYDNEMGFSARMINVCDYIAKQL